MPKITDSEVPRGGFLGKVYPHFGHVPTGRSHVSTTSPSQPFPSHWTAGPGLARLLLQRQNGEACKMERGPLSGQGQSFPSRVPPAGRLLDAQWSIPRPAAMKRGWGEAGKESLFQRTRGTEGRTAPPLRLSLLVPNTVQPDPSGSSAHARALLVPPSRSRPLTLATAATTARARVGRGREGGRGREAALRAEAEAEAEAVARPRTAAPASGPARPTSLRLLTRLSDAVPGPADFASGHGLPESERGGGAGPPGPGGGWAGRPGPGGRWARGRGPGGAGPRRGNPSSLPSRLPSRRERRGARPAAGTAPGDPGWPLPCTWSWAPAP